MRHRPPFLALAVLAGAALAAHLLHGYFSLHLTGQTTIAEIRAGRVRVGQALYIAKARFRGGPIARVPEYDRRDPKGERAYRFTVIEDPASGEKLVALLWRTSFPHATGEGPGFTCEVRGTLRRASAKDSAAILAGLGSELGSDVPVVFLDEMSFDPVAISAVMGVLVTAAALGAGLLMLIRSTRAPASRQTARAVSDRALAATRSRAAVAAIEKTWTCAACGTESPIASKGCSTCKSGLEIEYYVAGALPFEGFDRYVPLLARVLGVSEYQATQPLARVHTPIPYQHLESYHAKGAGANSPFRLAARGISSLVTARALAADLKERGVEAVVIGSDELKQAIHPRKAQAMRADSTRATFVFEQGPDREEREVRWSNISLIVFSAAMPLRGTMTIARDANAGLAADPSAYLLDIYERGNPEGIRIAEHSFHRWEFLKPGGSERPADRFGKLLELLEDNAREADIHYVSGIYRGPKSEWRMNFYSRFLYLVGEKVGWARQDGPPRLEGYEILDKIGEGGMGSVYRARQKKLGRLVAVKVIAPHLAAQHRFASRFQAEARAVAALSHPNIVQVIDLAESAGRHFMVMELVEGETLLRRIKERGRIEEAEALRIGLQVARALDHAWGRGIVHRDVKPDNIFVDPDGEAKLGDWGLAKEMESDLGLTETGTALGTPYYMSPEQARGVPDLDIRSDLYSLGATLFHAVAGVPPFRGGSPAEVISKHLSSPPPDPRTIAPEVSDETARALMRLLAKVPAERAADGAEAVRLLEHALAVADRELVYT